MAKPGVGQSKAALAARKAANKGVAAGTVRKGAGGKYMRKYNAKTGRWDIVGATKQTAAKYVAGVTKAAATNRAKAKPGMTTAQYAALKAKSDTVAPQDKPKTSGSRIEGPKVSKPVVRVGKNTVKIGPANFVRPKQKTPNRPERGKKMQIITQRDGSQRWVYVIDPKKK
jgi:hypothetical protein